MFFFFSLYAVALQNTEHSAGSTSAAGAQRCAVTPGVARKTKMASNWRLGCLDAAPRKEEYQKGKEQHVGENMYRTGKGGGVRGRGGPNHVKINLYGEIPTLIKQNC